MAGRDLRAGPLAVRYLDGDLRDIRLGNTEIIRRIYMVFQDRNWTARPWVIENSNIEDHGDSFTITVRARGTFDATPFAWTATIDGGSDGSVTYRVIGHTEAPFLRNRLGLCVLHPIEECVGEPVIIEHSDGTVESTRFPSALSPNQPFLDIHAMTHAVLPELFATVRFSGEVFETEDHRNWSDASFKTYCTPIHLPFPVTVQPDDVLEQQVSLRLEGATTTPISPVPEAVITPDGPARPLPGLGLQIPRGTHQELTPAQVEALGALHLQHLRVDIDCSTSTAGAELAAGVRQAQQLETRLWVALYVTDPQPLGPLLAGLTPEDSRVIDCWLIFDTQHKVTPGLLIEQVKGEILRASKQARVFSGTDLYFTELNREPLDSTALELLDGVCFSVNPQVHASDDQSVLQNAAGLGAIALDAPRLAGGLPIAISPLTLRPRFNPNATAPELDVSNTPLPSSVDARQGTNFGALWALLSVKEVAEAGTIDAVTIGETVGWRGVMADSAGSPDEQHFPCEPNERFPIWSALHHLAGEVGLIPTRSTRPDAVQALLLNQGSTQKLLLLNLTDTPQRVSLALDTGLQSWEIPAYGIVPVSR
jgi:hypothetical protein